MLLTLRHRTAAATAVLAVCLGGATAITAPAGASGRVAAAIVDPALRTAHGSVGIVVTGTKVAERAVVRAGGTITHQLPLIGGFSAKVPASDMPTIARVPGVATISLDRPTHVQSAPGTYNNLPSVYKKVTNGSKLASSGGDGHGVNIALIDTGVTALPDVANAIVPVTPDVAGLGPQPCLNLAGDGTCDDLYGHGTFMAGIMVGNGAASAGKFVGMAPQAGIVSVKVAGATGASDVSTLIAALQWVVQNQALYNIRVLNLSLGTDSTQPYAIDPLDYAAEKAWQAGIVVNVAASNRGPASGTISDPANDPFVVTVGAIDDKGTNGLNDDVLPNFTGRGPTASDGLAKPDVVAPGAHIVSLAAPGASITTQFPSTMAAPYRRGSGTSMATAVVSGLEAQMLSLQPLLTPKRVKYMLASTAHPDASSDRMSVGSGIVDGSAALLAGPGVANAGVPPSMGTGSLTASRGTTDVVLDDANNTVLDASSGDLTSTLTDVSEGASWFGASWFGASWFGASWFGASWFGASWFGASWFGASWFGQPDSAEDYGASWFGGAWYGSWDQ
jgi:serine protease AprX